ncbi:MAG: hypothetical protein KatS3mg110_3160 [Pirellulaceae bacterium]|nr:MAG: hypothetical protein KatS3mg110_3160 [Pirellulaceae bacterium]
MGYLVPQAGGPGVGVLVAHAGEKAWEYWSRKQGDKAWEYRSRTRGRRRGILAPQARRKYGSGSSHKQGKGGGVLVLKRGETVWDVGRGSEQKVREWFNPMRGESRGVVRPASGRKGVGVLVPQLERKCGLATSSPRRRWARSGWLCKWGESEGVAGPGGGRENLRMVGPARGERYSWTASFY